MKLPSYVIAVTCAALAILQSTARFGFGQEQAGEKKKELRSLGRLPEDRKLELPDAQEHNPFGEPVKSKKLEVANGDSEDARLSKRFSEEKVTGIIKDAQGSPKVLMFRTALKEGDMLPRLLKDQTIKLRVSKLTEKELEISTVEKDVNAQPRKMLKQFSLGDGMIRQQIAEDVMVTTLSNGETVEPVATDETAALKEEAFGNRGNTPPTTSLSSRPR